MEVCFVGPLGVVTGSCTWMRDIEKDWNFLIDCGMQQGEPNAVHWNSGDWPFNPEEIKFVVLTHAHIDHCGLIPLLYKKGFSGIVYCTKETSEIAKHLLRDACNQPNSPYSLEDLEAIAWREPRSEKQLGTYLPVDKDLFLQFYRTGHVMGAVSVVVRWGPPGDSQKSIVFSGDLGTNGEDEEGLPLIRFRMTTVSCDYAVVESTYGGVLRDRQESPSNARRSEFRKLLDQVIDSGGTLVIPAFSLGRTQDLLFDLHWIVAEDPDKYGQITYLLDSPLARRLQKDILKGLARQERTASGKVRPRWLGKQVFDILGLDSSDASQYNECLRLLEACLELTKSSPFVACTSGNSVAKRWRPILSHMTDREFQLNAASPGPRVVVTSSGSCDGGPVAAWLPKVLVSSRNIVALTGYAADTSVGGRLAAIMKMPLHERARDTGYLTWANDVTYPIAKVQAAIIRLSGYSAHADQKGLLDWLFWHYQDRAEAAGRAVFIQHGGNSQREKLAQAIGERAHIHGTTVEIFQPSKSHQWWNLERGARAMSIDKEMSEITAKMARLTAEMQRLQNYTAESA